jgi:hypothetical protein
MNHDNGSMWHFIIIGTGIHTLLSGYSVSGRGIGKRESSICPGAGQMLLVTASVTKAQMKTLAAFCQASGMQV